MGRQSEKESTDEDLMDPSAWDMESAVAHPPVENPETVISVKFNRAEFAEIAAGARENDLLVTKYLRLASLAWTRGNEKLETE